MADGLKSEAATVNEDEEYGSRLSGYGGQARTACDTIRFNKLAKKMPSIKKLLTIAKENF
uniref:Uncharacterized protein n=1 Tax=Pristionchus pacificus TaxID=54126 RepID=A0A2A6CGT1_PRIPA|eukprot:PDM77290.1 hypothetical protein PRIPAC_43202 [Pristionchus pacificus]